MEKHSNASQGRTERGKESQAVVKSTQKLVQKLKDMKSSQRDSLQQLDTAEQQCQKALQDHRDKLVKRIDEMTKADSDKIKSKFQGQKATVKKNIKYVDDQIDDMETIIKNLSESKGDNESELLAYIKQVETIERDGEQLLHTLQRMRIPEYNLHNTIDRSLSDVDSLGEFDEVERVRLKLKSEHRVKTAHDKTECRVKGVCLLPDASVMIIDWKNQSLKHLDASYKVTSSLGMATEPYDVCYIDSNNELAVTLTNEKKVQFVCVGVSISMRKTRSFLVDEFCRGIAFSKGELFVCCGSVTKSTGGNVRVYSLSGTPLRTIQHGPNKQPLYTMILYITVSSCGNKLHVTDKNNGIITTDRTGKLLTTFTDPDLEYPSGICTLDNDDILVCGLDSDNVLHLTKDGRKLDEVLDVVLGEQDEVDGPLILTYDCVNSRLIVATYKSDTIQLYDVVKE